MFVCSVPKTSQVMIKWRRRASHLSRFQVLCSTTAAELHNSVDLRCETTAAELHNSVNLLCGTTAAELTRFDACIISRRHFPKTGTNHAEKYEGLIQSKINSKRLKDERLGRFSKHRSMYALLRFSKLFKR